MSRWTRFVRFNTVGAIGVGVQLGSLWLLADLAHVHYLVATLTALALSVVHNFVWHWRWTWRDRTNGGGLASAFMRFAGANGALSLAGNLGVMTTLVAGAQVSPVVANSVAIAVCGLLNYSIGDGLVFRPVASPSSRTSAAGWRSPALSPDNAPRWDSDDDAVEHSVERPSERSFERQPDRQPDRPPPRRSTRATRAGL